MSQQVSIDTEAQMCLKIRFLAVMTVLAFTACGGEGSASSDDRQLTPVPSAVDCADASQLRQRSIDDRRQGQALASDQAKIDAGNRARFFASLAIIAELKCKVALAEADEALETALEAARTAATTASFYRRTLGWAEADYVATEVIAMLVGRLPAVRPE